MKREENFTGLRGLIADINTTDSVQTYNTLSSAFPGVGLEISNNLDDSVMYPEQSGSSFIAYPR